MGRWMWAALAVCVACAGVAGTSRGVEYGSGRQSCADPAQPVSFESVPDGAIANVYRVDRAGLANERLVSHGHFWSGGVLHTTCQTAGHTFVVMWMAPTMGE